MQSASSRIWTCVHFLRRWPLHHGHLCNVNFMHSKFCTPTWNFVSQFWNSSFHLFRPLNQTMCLTAHPNCLFCIFKDMFNPGRSDTTRFSYIYQIVSAVILIVWVSIYVKLVTVVEGDLKAPFSIATTPRCRGGRYAFAWIAPLYSWYVPYNAEC